MSTKYEILMDNMYDVINFMHSCINFIGEVDGKILCYGKLYDSWEQVESIIGPWDNRNGFVRYSNVQDYLDNYYIPQETDDDVVSDICTVMYTCAEDFLLTQKDGDLQTLYLGCLLNVYYSYGLFNRCGTFDLERLSQYWIDEKTRKYAEMLNDIYLRKIADTFWYFCKDGMFPNKIAVEYCEQYILNHDEELLERIIKEMDSKFSIARGFVKEYAKNWNSFEKYRFEGEEDNDDERIFLKLKEICPEYQFANLLLGIKSSYNFFKLNGKNEIAKYMNLLDDDFFKISVGVKTPRLKNFFLPDPGLPYIKYIYRYEGSKRYDEKFVYTINFLKNNCSIFFPCEIRVDEKDIIDKFLPVTIDAYEAKGLIEKTINEKNTVIRQFSHTYMNMRATSLYNIAVELLKNPDKKYRNYGRKLLYEYSVKKNLTKDVEMLKLRFEDNKEELCNMIADSILQKNREGIKIQELIDEAIIRCMVTLVHDGSIKAKNLRNRFEGYDWISIRNSFETDVLLSDICDVKKWFNKNMFSIDFSICDSWDEIVFEKDSYASLLFVNILSELLTNILRYADTNRSIEFKFEKNDNSVLILSTKNHMKIGNHYSGGSGFGLQAEKDIFKILNQYYKEEIETLVVKSENDIFEVHFQISGKLFEKE